MTERSMIVGERVMFASGEVPVNCVFTVRIKGTLLEADMISALKKMQAKHPLLRSSIQLQAGIPTYQVLPEAPVIPLRVVVRRKEDDWVSETASQWLEPFDYGKAPLMRVIWLKGEMYSEVLIILPHCIADGASLVNLMKEFLQLLDQPGLAVASYSLPRNVDDLLGQKNTASGIKRIKLTCLAGLASLYFACIPQSKKLVINKPYWIRNGFNSQEVNQLKTLCKINGVTMHTAMSLALLQAFKKIKNKKARGKIICPVDIRAKVKSIRKDMIFSFAPIIQLELRAIKGNDFWPMAIELQQQLKKKTDQVDPGDQLRSAEYFQRITPNIVKMLRSTDGTHDVTFSNMGILDIPPRYEHFEVARCFVPSAAMPWKNANTMVAATFQNEMEICLMSAEDFLDPKEARAILDEFKNILLTACVDPQELAGNADRVLT